MLEPFEKNVLGRMIAFIEGVPETMLKKRQVGMKVGEYSEVEVPLQPYREPTEVPRRTRVAKPRKRKKNAKPPPPMTDAEFEQMCAGMRVGLDRIAGAREAKARNVRTHRVRKDEWVGILRLTRRERASLTRWMKDQPKHISHRPWNYRRKKNYYFARVSDRTSRGLFRAEFVWETGLFSPDEKTGEPVQKIERCCFSVDVWLRVLDALKERK